MCYIKKCHEGKNKTYTSQLSLIPPPFFRASLCEVPESLSGDITKPPCPIFGKKEGGVLLAKLFYKGFPQ